MPELLYFWPFGENEFAHEYTLLWNRPRNLMFCSMALPGTEERIYLSMNGNFKFITTANCTKSLYCWCIIILNTKSPTLQVILYGDPIPWKKQENVLYMSNHQCTVDWVVADLLAIRQGSLGRIRYILKSGLKYLPLYGFYFAQVKIRIYIDDVKFALIYLWNISPGLFVIVGQIIWCTMYS